MKMEQRCVINPPWKNIMPTEWGLPKMLDEGRTNMRIHRWKSIISNVKWEGGKGGVGGGNFQPVFVACVCLILQAELAVQRNPTVQGVYLIFNATKPALYSRECAFGGPILPGSQPPSSASALCLWNWPPRAPSLVHSPVVAPKLGRWPPTVWYFFYKNCDVAQLAIVHKYI